MEWCPVCNTELLESDKGQNTPYLGYCPVCKDYLYICPDCGSVVELDEWNIEQNVCWECEYDEDEDNIIVFTCEEDTIIDTLFGLTEEGE